MVQFVIEKRRIATKEESLHLQHLHHQKRKDVYCVWLMKIALTILMLMERVLYVINKQEILDVIKLLLVKLINQISISNILCRCHKKKIKIMFSFKNGEIMSKVSREDVPKFLMVLLREIVLMEKLED